MTTAAHLADELAGIAELAGGDRITDTDRATLREAADLLANLGDLAPVDDPHTTRVTLDIRLPVTTNDGLDMNDPATRPGFVVGFLRGALNATGVPVTIVRVHPAPPRRLGLGAALVTPR